MKTEGYSDRQDNAHYTKHSSKLSELAYCLCIPKYGQLHATRGGLRTRLSKHNTGRHSSCHGSLPGRGQHNAAHDAGIDPRGVSAVTRHSGSCSKGEATTVSLVLEKPTDQTCHALCAYPTSNVRHPSSLPSVAHSLQRLCMHMYMHMYMCMCMCMCMCMYMC